MCGEDGGGVIIQADAAHLPLADESVHCVVSSPPYWGLRRYEGQQERVWGGGPACQHEWGKRRTVEVIREATTIGKTRTTDIFYVDESRRFNGNHQKFSDIRFCQLCGAVKCALGLEPQLSLYVDHIVQVFREIKRVLRSDGTCWLNIADSYASTPPGNKNTVADGLKPKDLCLIPFRLALALQSDGWWIRSDIIWSKPNPMPESVTDRPTRAHEYIFLLAKSERYFFDQDAVRVPLLESSIGRITQPSFDSQTGGSKDYGHRTNSNRSARRALCNLKEKYVSCEKWGDRFSGWDARDKTIGRNTRSVWQINTQPYPEAHYATFPEELVERCIAAGTSSRGCCAACGAPWERVVQKTTEVDQSHRGSYFDRGKTGVNGDGRVQPGERFTSVATGWRPTCACKSGAPIPCRVLDPFCGSGTTVEVAFKMGRRGIGCDLSWEYVSKLARDRIPPMADVPMMAV